MQDVQSTDLEHEHARVKRRAKRNLTSRLLALEGVERRPSHDRGVQLAVVTLFIVGYTLEDIVRASNGQLSVDEALNAVRQVVAAEIKELLPLARSSLSWPNLRH